MIIRGASAQAAFDGAVSDAAQTFIKCVDKEDFYAEVKAAMSADATDEERSKGRGALAELLMCFHQLKFAVDFKAPHARPMDRVRHIKRNSTYTTVDAKFQVSKGDPDVASLVGTEMPVRVVEDGQGVRVYRDEESGEFYVRFHDEFTPDRFETL